MRFLSRSDVRPWFEGKRVAVVGSGPGVLDNPEGLVDSHDVVVRVNNYKLSNEAGLRVDCHYSFYGNSIRKGADELIRDGVKLCLCKCPNAAAIDSEWHRINGKTHGTDFRWIYEKRRGFWFCDTWVPTLESFLAKFVMLGNHIPTTGFAAILDVLSFGPAHVYLTGFDFFTSGRHNVTEPWRMKNADDPIGHVPGREREWLMQNLDCLPVACDPALARSLAAAAA